MAEEKISGSIGARILLAAFMLVGCSAADSIIDEKNIDCNECEVMSQSEFRRTLDQLQTEQPMWVDIFADFRISRPVAVPLRAVEQGTRCTISDHVIVSKLQEMISGLRMRAAEPTVVSSVLEIRFYRPGPRLGQPVLEAFLNEASLLNAEKEGGALSIVMNGKVATVDARQLLHIEDAVAQIINGPTKSHVCVT